MSVQLKNGIGNSSSTNNLIPEVLVELSQAFGGAIDIFVDRCFGHYFNQKPAWDQEFINKTHDTDETGLKIVKLTPPHIMAVFVKELKVTSFYSRGLEPASSIRHP